MNSLFSLLKQAAAGVVNAAADRVIIFVNAGGRLATKDEAGNVAEYMVSGDEAVTSVNGETGEVVLDADDIDEGIVNRWFTDGERAKLAGVESGAQVNTVASVHGRTGNIAAEIGDYNFAQLAGAAINSQLADMAGDTLKGRASGTGSPQDLTVAQVYTILRRALSDGLASLNSQGKVPSDQLPALALTDIEVVADIAARDALDPDTVTVAIVEDASADPAVESGAASYIYDPAEDEWYKLRSPDALVQSVNGETGTIVLDTDDIDEGAENLYYTETRVSANEDVAANTAARHAAVSLGDANGLSLDDQQVSLALATGSASGAMPAADKAKTDNLTVTAATNLDNIRIRVDELDAAVVLQGEWDPTTGVFPGGGSAQPGHSWIVVDDDDVDGVEFRDGDRITALVEDASTTVYAGNWLKQDYTDRVSSVHGRVGNVVGESGDYDASEVVNDSGVSGANVAAALDTLESEKADASALGTAAAANTGVAVAEVPTGADLNASEGWPTHVWLPDKMRAEVEAASGGQCTVLYDDVGLPSIMRIIPVFRYEDLGFDSELGTGTCTAFVVDGVEKPEIFIGQYLASVTDNRAYSLPGRAPTVSLNWDTAVSRCAAKGAGWHLMTVHEWAAVALWCMANDFQPRGNTNQGQAHDATHERGRRVDGLSSTTSVAGARTLAGSGPVTWRHDSTFMGIADLVGNVWEWQWGLKLDDGQIHIAPDNDFTLAEGAWITTIDGNEHWLSNEPPATLRNTQGTSINFSTVSPWSSLAKADGYNESQLLQRLLISPAGISPQGALFGNAGGERFPIRGGARSSGGSAGLAALNLGIERSSTISNFGFRPAFVA